MDLRIYLSLKEDIMSELIEKYQLTLETVKEVLSVNKFRERFRNNNKQFEYMEIEEIAEEFYNTYKILRDKEMAEIEEIIIQRTSEKRYTLSGQELFDETVRLLNEHIAKEETDID